jgi:hypothetical protein
MPTQQKRTDREKSIDDSFEKYAVQPVAKPVDTYVSPPRPKDETSEIRQFAAALAGFSEAVVGHARVKRDEERVQKGAEGEKLYAQYGMGQSWADFRVANPTVPNNPYIKEGFLKARASNAAELFRSLLNEKYNSNKAVIGRPDGTFINVKNTDDPNAFFDWAQAELSGFVSSNMGDFSQIDNASFSQIFMPSVEDAITRLQGDHITERKVRLYADNVAETTQVVNSIIDAHFETGLVSTDYAGAQALANQLSNVNAQKYMEGISPDDVATIEANALVAYAERNPDRDMLLYLMSQIHIADGKMLSDYAKQSSYVSQNARELYRYNEQKRRDEKREREEAENEEASAEMFSIVLDVNGTRSTADTGVWSRVHQFGVKYPKYQETLQKLLNSSYDNRRHRSPHAEADRARYERDSWDRYQLDVLKGNLQPPESVPDVLALEGRLPIKYIVAMGQAVSENQPTVTKLIATNRENINSAIKAKLNSIENLGGNSLGGAIPPALLNIYIPLATEQLMKPLVERVGQDPGRYLNDPVVFDTALQQVLEREMSNIEKNLKNYADWTPAGISWEDTEGQLDYAAKKEEYADNLISKWNEYTSSLSDGGDSSKTEFAKFVNEYGLTKAEAEVILGTPIPDSLWPAKSKTKAQKVFDVNKKKPRPKKR